MVTKDQRQRQLAREKFERQQERRSAARSKGRRRNAVIASVVAVLLAAGGVTWAAGGLDGNEEDPARAAAVSADAPSVEDPCEKAGKGSPATKTWKEEPELGIGKSTKYTMTLATTCGDIPLTLNAAKAPRTVNSFKFLSDEGYFDHTECHRLTTEGIFVLQCGDPTAKGDGGPGYTIPDENLKDASVAGGTYPAGTVAMANTGSPGTGGSQFFLVYKDSPLPPSYTPFGTIDDAGMKVLEKISGAGATPADPTTGNTAPNATVVIDKAVVAET